MITVHHLDSSRSQRILRLLEEIGLRYTYRMHFAEGPAMPPLLLKRNFPPRTCR